MKMKNHFKVNYVSVFIIAVLLVVLSGCGLDSDKMKDHFEAGRAGESYEEYMENKNKQETEEAEEKTVKEESVKDETKDEVKETDYTGVYEGFALYENGSYSRKDIQDTFDGWYVKLEDNGKGFLYFGDDNQGDLTSWSMDGDKLTIKAGVSEFAGRSTIKDGIMLLDFDDYVIAFLSPEVDKASLPLEE